MHKCYKIVNEFEDREMSIVVVRRHPQGTFTFGAFMNLPLTDPYAIREEFRKFSKNQ